MKLESVDERKVSYFYCRSAFGAFVEVNASSPDLWDAVKAQAGSWDGIIPLLTRVDLLSN